MTDPQLTYALQECSLNSLLSTVSKALARSGYGDVQYLGRHYPRQKSRFGGHELICETVMGPNLHRVVVKVVRDTVRIRNLDELAGTVTRVEADAGLIVSPFPLTKRAASFLDCYGPVRTGVIAGESLAAWLTNLGIGVTPTGLVDWRYFGHVEEATDQVLSFLTAAR